MNPIAYCKIFPPIGIARLGDSADESGYYIGPECPDNLPHKQEGFSFRDADGRIKRRVARFRIYAFDENDRVVSELTSDNATITWRSRLANKKAAWFQFSGTKQALDSITGARDPAVRVRNAGVGAIERAPEGPIGRKYRSNAKRASQLEIRPPEVTISGASEKSSPKEPNPRYTFVGKFKGVHSVYLGELRTDEKGRLLVFGSRGVSDAVDENGQSIRAKQWIQSYANNDDWFDDTSDGYVRAEVRLKDTGEPVEVRGGAWVIVASPRYSPDTQNIVTLFDVMEEVLYDNQDLLSSKEFPAPRGRHNVDYEQDIKPILKRAFDYAWVNESALRGHGYNKPGDHRAPMDGSLGIPDNLLGQSLRERVFERIRIPTYSRPTVDGNDRERNVDDSVKREQASRSFMPQLSGDEGDTSAGDPTKWLTVTHLQYDRLEAWSKGNFAAPPDKAESEASESKDQSYEDRLQTLPYLLTKTALDDCAGGAFYPGIEMTSIARHPALYREAYRLNDEILEPGDVTKHMALPWQADFFECVSDWWPAQRPDDVLTNEDFDEIFESFEEETVGAPDTFESVVFNRKRWDRGLGRSRPQAAFLRSLLLPTPKASDTVGAYINGASGSVGRAAFVASSLFARTPASNFTSDSIESAVRYAERMPSPWRLQFVTQEILDQFSGRFFHIVAPSPELIFREPGEKPKGDNAKRPESPKPLADLHASWNTFRSINPPAASLIVATYADEVFNSIRRQIGMIFEEHPAANKPVSEYYEAIDTDSRALSESLEDFTASSDIFKRLRLAQMVRIMLDVLYIRHSNQAGDMDMVEMWRELGFVVEQKKVVVDRAGEQKLIRALIEIERGRYDGLSFRDYFYFFMNIAKYPDFPAYAKVLAERFFKQADGFIQELGITDPRHPESFVEYNEVNFNAKMEQIYEILRAGANNEPANSPWLRNANREDAARVILSLAPFNQTDGSWLRNISKAGTSDELRGLLFDIWSDEIGNGDPLLHHGNLYTALLRQLGIVLPDITSRAYADHSGLSERFMVGAVLPLAVSQTTDEFFPEILGMTLFLEWEILSVVPGIKLYDYLGIDSHFYRMHVGIDNATHGHGYAAKRAVELYLDNVSNSSGPEAVQAHWRRIWRGFVAFALGGSGIFSNDVGQDDDTIAQSYPGSPADRVVALMGRKKRYGNLQHGAKKIGGFAINDLFDDPGLFIEELGNSPWVTPGAPDKSGLLTLLTRFQGPMYKIFDDDDLATWREWVVWLAKEGDTLAPKEYIGKGEAMLLLLTELRELAISEQGHTRYKLDDAHARGGSTAEAPERQTIAEWFREPDLKILMRALADPKNGWVVPGRADLSPLVVDMLQGNRRMGRVLNQRFECVGNEIGRLVVVRWVRAGCPIPGEAPPTPEESRPIKPQRIQRLLVQQYGMGAVH